MEERNNKEDFSFISIVGIGAHSEGESALSDEIVKFRNLTRKFKRRRKFGVF